MYAKELPLLAVQQNSSCADPVRPRPARRRPTPPSRPALPRRAALPPRSPCVFRSAAAAAGVGGLARQKATPLGSAEQLGLGGGWAWERDVAEETEKMPRRHRQPYILLIDPSIVSLTNAQADHACFPQGQSRRKKPSQRPICKGFYYLSS